MPAIRSLLVQRHLAVLICAAALLMKLLVPAGYMIGGDHGGFAITVCPGTTPGAMTMEMPGMPGDLPHHGPSSHHGKPATPCAFSALSAAALGPVDPIQLAALIVFVMGAGLAGTILPAPSGPSHLRPPLRGPPALL